jgi:UDP-N-acetylglucosamine--N-acetylmuramyl-(pentapeptide) pyrophosphoryl-undecaprenol N-acetylglucosamine transferase
MVYEPNAMPGLANRLVGKRVQAAAINFPAAQKWFRNAEVTGVPVRPEFFSLAAPTGAPHLLVFGGSQGARIFNVHLPQIVRALLDAVPGLTVLHQSGLRNFEATQAAYAASGADPARWQVQPFVDKMAAEFARAHLIMSRSGATTVAEEAAAAKPALLVPFAAAADQHQRRNAEAMAAAGAAVMLEEKDLDIPDKLLGILSGLVSDPERLAAMAAAARAQAHPGAAERIADRLAELAGKQRS